jgi:molybdate/tungstate transport system ATP-binding protein
VGEIIRMIEIIDLSIELGRFALHHVDLSIRDGEYLVLLGPTGSGKTVLVECIAGIHRKHGGRILVDGRDVTGLYPEERHIGYVPQDYALFPNLTVRENVAYGLRARRLPEVEIVARVNSMLKMLGLSQLAERSPTTLSGGEKQRTALGRALVTNPRILLLDEPLSAIDEVMRSELATELSRIQRAVNGTFLHVCHSFDEATEVADRVAILREGSIAQVGTIEELLEKPASLFVARFTGARNLFSGVAEERSGGSVVTLADGVRLACGVRSAGPGVAAIRPEKILLANGLALGSAENVLEGRVTGVKRKMAHVEVVVDAGIDLVVYLPRAGERETPEAGCSVTLRIPPEAIRLLPSE